jgi:hypothetical protein
LKNTLFIKLLLIFLFVQPSLYGQEVKIVGIVKDISKTAIQRASIILYDGNENTISYVFSNEEGEFTLEFQKKETAYKLSISSLGCQRKEVPLLINNSVITLEVVLDEKTETLNEIIVSGEKRNDTTKIAIAKYINQTEQTVEDVLKKLPGVEVLEDGSIKAHGKYISKLLIEGDDILDKNYKLLSKNLDAKFLESVEILDNFEDNPILKKLFASEKVALNLKLKKEKQNIWFGNVNVGAGIFSENRWKEGINVGLLRKKIKLFYFADYNNSGEKATSVLADNIMEDNFFGEDRYERKTKNLFSISSNENTSFGKTQSVFNNAFLNSLNFTTKIKPNLTFRGVTYLANDKQVQNSFSQSQYNIEQQPVVFTETNNYKSNKTLAGTEFETKYYPNDKNYFTNTFVYKNNPNTVNNTTIFNNTNVTQNSSTKNQTVYNHLRHTFTLNRQTIINNYLYFGYDNDKNNSKIKSPLLNDFLSANTFDFVDQNFDNTLRYFGIKSKLMSRYKKLEYTFDVNYENNHEVLKNNFLVNQSNNATYENNTLINQNIFKSSLNLRYRFTNKIYFTTTLNHTYNHFIQDNLVNNISFLNPTASLNINITKSARLGLTYAKKNSVPETNYLLKNSFLSNYRSFTQGLRYEKPVEQNSYSLNYYVLKDAKKYAINATISYSDSKSTIGSENNLDTNFSFTDYIYANGGKNYFGNFSFTKFISSIQTSLKIETLQVNNESILKINNTSFETLNNYNSRYKFTGRSYLTGAFNFDFNCAYNTSQSKFNNTTSKNNTKDAALNLIYSTKSLFIFEFGNNYYNINKENYYFTSGVVNYNPKESRFSYRLVLNNLFNRTEFTTVNIDNYTSYTQSIPLVARYVLLNVKYRF